MAPTLKASAQPVFKVVKENLGPLINDVQDQVLPMFAPGRNTLFFSQNTGVNETYEVWQTQRDGMGNWGAKQKTGLIGGPGQLNKYVFGAHANDWFLINGKFTNKNDSTLFEKGFSWYQSKGGQFKIGGTQTLQIDGLDDMLQGQIANAFYAANKNVLLLSFAQQGKRDIFICTPKPNQQMPILQWNRPMPLPESINTDWEESCPFLDETGSVLYFSSNRPGGFGGDDIYYSKALSSDLTQWSPAQNLGFYVNSNKSELYYSISSVDSTAYFVSYKNSYGAGDIFRIRFSMDDKWSKPLVSAEPAPLVVASPKPNPAQRPIAPVAMEAPVISGAQLSTTEYNPNNVLLLLDVSTSMASNSKMNILRKASDQLLTRLRYIDKVSLITFGEQAKLVYQTASLRNKDSVLQLLNKQQPVEAETYINLGLYAAYRQAIDTYIEGGNNEILVVTDGYFSISATTLTFIKNNPQIRLSFILVDAGSIAPNITNYVRQQLPASNVVEMTNENLDVNKMLDIIEQHSRRTSGQ